MRVIFNTAEQWMAEIQAESRNVLGGIVRMRTDREPEQPEAVTFRVGVWLTAVIVNESGPYLVEFGDAVGCDDNTTPNGGTDAARDIAMQLQSLADALNLELREGKIESF